MDENIQAVETTETPVTESAPVEEVTVDTSEESSEKTQTTSEETQSTDSPVKNQAIPYERFSEVNEKAKKYEAELKELRARQ